ncbi:SixA phosphatase family protein [Cellulomonas iranensis]|uniref:Phosphohistidine phosphatase n=1 Tax=Cellulomonas iranensis TaxID=76862 RepID=A0ABU0GE76_9CELL|nr:histidine phosphatase family protein [Cellulomonas iranensis]MDQ0423659.1 phosphohistidine phosphatase [Cellulomonas iranensis]
MSTHHLVILRHAKAEPGGAVVDHERPLALAGRRQASAVGAALAEAGLAPTHVLCSSALRTRQTWELVRTPLAAAGAPDAAVTVTDALYDAGAAEVLGLVRGVPQDAATVLVVGHEPTVSHVADALAGPGSDGGAVARVRPGVPTATWSLLEVDGPWARLDLGAARLVAVRTP